MKRSYEEDNITPVIANARSISTAFGNDFSFKEKIGN